MMAGDRGRDRDVPCSASPARLEVGERSHWLLSNAAGWRSVHHGKLLPALYGLPIEPTSEMQYRYRVLNGAGAVILEGELEP